MGAMSRRRVALAAASILVSLFVLVPAGVSTLTAQAPRARISETTRQIPTYPFSEPNPVPILARDTRLYPYFSFEGYAHDREMRPWKVVTLENDWIVVEILPEVGGKVWGARVKSTGHDFIYKNDALKFRNVALRGPWTSGGIEFNFGVVGHTPSTATPVDYALRENADGSVSCIVGTMDLPSHTEWRVEIRLPAGKAAFETNVLWHNPTTLTQPYYNWMTAAAFAKDDLVMSIPGNAYLDHPGPRHDWPTDAANHYLPAYAQNRFGSNKSFHVAGELKDTFGGYYADAGFGFGHWARHEEMPGQKLWLWALSRAGGIWEDLLTDRMGQYVEYQAGRLLVQYTPGANQTPVRQAAFDPMATDRWSETWFPVEGLGALTEASRDGALGITEKDGQLTIAAHSFIRTTDTLKVWIGDRVVLEKPLTLSPLAAERVTVARPAGARYRVALPALALAYDSDVAARRLSRPFDADAATAAKAMSVIDAQVFEARELVEARRYELARPLLEKALAANGWHHDALLAMADLEYRRARYAQGLMLAEKALRLDTYDATANMTAANLYRALGREADARDAYGWAARSLTYRTAANTALAELALVRHDWPEAARYASIALDYNRLNLTAWESLAIAERKAGEESRAAAALREIDALDPLSHFVRAERYLGLPGPTGAKLTEGLRSEFPDESVMELAAGYVRRGQSRDAADVLGAAASPQNPIAFAWHAALTGDTRPFSGTIAFAFPYRAETLPVLEKAVATWPRDDRWKYLLALNLWAFDRVADAMTAAGGIGNDTHDPVIRAGRAALRLKVDPADRSREAEADLKDAVGHGGDMRLLHVPLVQYYQSQNRWADSLTAATAALERFKGDFNLQIMQARAFVRLERPADALTVLDATRVLPSEGARESHQLHVQAHVMAALDAYGRRAWDDAARHLTAALEWPEHLGQGKPYDPEERLIRFVLARVDARRGRAQAAADGYRAVKAASKPGAPGTALDVLGWAAARALGEPGPDQSPARPSLVARAAASGDVDARLIQRALDLR